MNLEKFREYFNLHDGFSHYCGMTLAQVADGYAKVELTLEDNGKNFMGSMHGGLLYTMADVAAGAAVMYESRRCVTLSAYTDYVKSPFGGKIIAEANLVSHGRKINRCEVTIHADDGTVYCRSYVTMYMKDQKISKNDFN